MEFLILLIKKLTLLWIIMPKFLTINWKWNSIKRKIWNEYYKMKLKQWFTCVKKHQNQTYFNYYKIISQMFYVHNKKGLNNIIIFINYILQQT